MSEAADGATPSRPAWQPFTFGGLAAFAQAHVGRVLLAELAVALLISGSVVGFLQQAYAPVILQAIEAMPETAKIDKGHLAGVDTTIIADTKLLAIAVTPEPSSSIGQSADVQIQFRPSNFRVGSVFQPDWGLEFDYGPGATLDLSRSKLEPWWGAWRPVLLAAVGVAILVTLFVIWAIMALFYTLPAILISWFSDRQLSLDGAWKLSSAALLPGGLLVALALLLYGSQAIDMVALAYFYATHLLTGWVYLIGGTLARPRAQAAPIKQNPFLS